MATGRTMSHFTEAATLNAWLRGTAFTPPTTLYAGLFTVAPTDAGNDGTEVAGGAYARQAITFGAPAPQSPSGNQVANSNAPLFPAATAGWGTVTSWGIWDAATGGNLLFSDNLTFPLTVTTGLQPQFAIGALTILLD